MSFIFQKVPFLIELLFNGSFILFYTLISLEKLPINLSTLQIDSILNISTKIVPLVIAISVILNYRLVKSMEVYFRKHAFSLLVLIPLIITWNDPEFAFWLSSVHLVSSALNLYDKQEYDKKSKKKETGVASLDFYSRLTFKPAQIVLASFSGLIGIGTFLLVLPISAVDGKTISLTDAFFMATSATCVTGLSTLSVNDNLSLIGQMVLLILIQIGGLGIMTLSSSMTILLGKSMAMKDRILMQDLLDVSGLNELIEMIIDIIKYTFIIELWGGIVLTIAFTFEGFEFGKALYYGFFHSISAFCNAGFSLFNNSLENFATNPLIHGTTAVLITLGGLGFIVLKEFKTIVFKGSSLQRLSLHSKIVLVTSFILTASGAVLIFFSEFLNGLDGYSLFEKIQISLFQSVTLRTAGFNTIPLTSFHSYTLYMMSMFMFIGASPGSTGGGVKTTSFAILIESIHSTLKGRNRVEMFDRQIPEPLVVRVTALFILSIIVATLFIFMMMRFEPEQSFLTLFFEVLSASGTVGLTLGVTPYLSILGKITISVLMFIGRVGPLTLVLAIGQQRKSSGSYNFPQGKIMIG